MKQAITLTILVLFCGLSAKCQSSAGWEAGVWLGSAHYFGDLKTSTDLKDAGIAGGIKARYLFNNRVGFSTSLNYGRVSAFDENSENAWERTRNLHFRSGILDATGMLEFNFLPFEHGSYNNYFTPYLGVGASIFHFNPKAELGGEWFALQELGTEGQVGGEQYAKVSGALAIAFGLKYNINYYWSLNFEVSTRRAFTDYIDDVSTVYPTQSTLSPQSQVFSDRSLPDADGTRLVRDGRQRGDSNTRDNYNFIGVSLIYWFGTVKCPAINRDLIPD